MSKLSKADLIDAVYNRAGVYRKDVKSVVDLFIEELKTALALHNTVELRGLGTFTVKTRKGRSNARNPKTGEQVSVASRSVVSFKPGIDLKRDVKPL
jgi:integration host factor subunit beta